MNEQIGGLGAGTEVGGEEQKYLLRLGRMSDLKYFVFGLNEEEEKRKEDEDYERNGPKARDGDELGRFEEELEKRVIKFTGSAEEMREFNLKLDKKLDEYRKRVTESNSQPDSEIYKDSLYKLMIGADLRNLGEAKLGTVYEKIQGIIGDGKIDTNLLINAWKVMSARTEGRDNVVKGKPAF